MADRFPLILNTSASQIQEIASGDQLDLTGNNIANAGIITATAFHGDGSSLTGIDGTALKDPAGNVKIQAQASGAVHTGIHTFSGNVGFAASIGTPTNVNINVGSNDELQLRYNGNIGTLDLFDDQAFCMAVRSAHTLILRAKFGINTPALGDGYGLDIDDVRFGPATSDYDMGSSLSPFGTLFAKKGDFSGDVVVGGGLTVGGVLTYEDVTNIDSIGIITARSGVDVDDFISVGSNIHLGNAGIVTAVNFVKTDGTTVGGAMTGYNNDPGENNVTTFIAGRGAGNNIQLQNSDGQSAHGNVLIGDGAGGSAQNGYDYNVSIGSYANNSLRDGLYNISIGYRANPNVSTQNSSNTIAIGYETLNSFVGGGVGATNGNNTVLGSYACRTLQTGGNNTVIGQAAEPSSANVSNEITLGHTSVDHFRVPGIGVSFSEGGGVVTGIMSASSFKLLDGTAVGGVVSDAEGNTVGGTNSGNSFSGTSAIANTLYGFDTGTALTTGDHNTIIGYQAGDALVDSSENVIIGSNCGSGANQSTASRNVIIGYEAVKTQDNPNDIVAIGYKAMGNSKDDASGNVAIGAYCLEHQTPSQEVSNITAIGAYAGQKTQSGFGQSVLVGYAAGQNINNSDYTTAIGFLSLRGTSTGPLYGYRNTGCGYRTLTSLITTGEKNTALGSEAGDALTTGKNNTCIGYNAQASSNTVENEITLGDTNINKFRIPGLSLSVSTTAASINGLDLSGLLRESVNVTAGKLSDNLDIDLTNGMVHYFTTQETTTSRPNLRFNSSTTLNSVMDVNESISVTIITTAAAAAYSANLNIDGSTSVVVNWIGGSAPSAGGSSGLDIYTYTIIKTSNATYKVIGNLTKTS